MDCHRDFREKCVRAALRNVTHKFYFYNIEDVNTELVSDEEDRFMRAFDTLQMYPHVAQMIDLIQRFNIKAYIFSNASKQQLDKLFNNSPDLASYKDSFERIISAEEVEAFKPSQRTYDHILDVVNREAEDVWFVSANPTDLVGAKAAGMQTAWINPRRFTWEDHLGDIWWDLPPDLDLDCVFEAVAEILSRDDTVPYGYRGRRHRNCPEPQVEESDADVEDEEEESVSDNDMTEPEAGADILHPIVIDDDETESEADADDIMSTMELDDETEVEADADEIMSTIESDDETEVDSGPEKDSEMK